jgi:hypothetical protein
MDRCELFLAPILQNGSEHTSISVTLGARHQTPDNSVPCSSLSAPGTSRDLSANQNSVPYEENYHEQLETVSTAILAFGTLSAPSRATASVAINIGVQPACPYGYFDYAPYSCAPYGYYGPEWFNGSVFIGAGP